MTTKHSKLKESIALRIRSTQYAVGSLIPSEAELAQEFNVSRNTVRQALNELENAGYLLRQRGKGTFVRDNGIKQSQKIALFIYDATDIQHSVTTKMISGFTSVLEKEGFILDILLSPRTYQEEDLVLLSKKYCSFAFATSRLDPLTVNALSHLSIPYLFIKNYLPGRNDAAVRIDFFRAGFMAAEHLKECDCRSLGLVYPGKHIPIAEEFFNGVCAAAMENGLFMKQEHIFETGGYVSEEVNSAGEKLASMPNRPDGIVTASDSTARMILDIFTRSGIAVPRDVMITGCNDTSDIPKMTNPPLTTVALPMEETGRAAARMLIEMIHGKQPESIMMQPAMSIRESTILK